MDIGNGFLPVLSISSPEEKLNALIAASAVGTDGL
jgi:hypothetical protein